jgi:hypothetical protein
MYNTLLSDTSGVHSEGMCELFSFLDDTDYMHFSSYSLYAEESDVDDGDEEISKEMTKVKVAFKRWDKGTLEEARNGKILVGYQEIGCHMIFDIKMDSNFTRKARLVAGGHTTEAPASITYSSVVSREKV